MVIMTIMRRWGGVLFFGLWENGARCLHLGEGDDGW